MLGIPTRCGCSTPEHSSVGQAHISGPFTTEPNASWYAAQEVEERVIGEMALFEEVGALFSKVRSQPSDSFSVSMFLAL